MTAVPGKDVFALRVGYDQDELLGARWWQESLRVAAMRPPAAAGTDESRRNAMRAMVGLGGAALFGGLLLTRCGRDDSTAGVSSNSLDLQKSRGAYLDASREHLGFPDATPLDVMGGGGSREDLDRLIDDLRPDDPALLPYYVPTLFSSLTAPGNEVLRSDFRMIHSAAMQRAFGQGEALRSLLEHAENAPAWLLVVDLPGPESVAFAAALEPVTDSVFTFDNWPHPRGVVPAHLTLAATVYHRFSFRPMPRAAPHPVTFVLDRNRLAPYRDEPQQFDNRYLAKLPPAEALRARGVERVLYVVPPGPEAIELDDLNARFVEYRQAGIQVRMLGLGDLTLGDPPAQPANQTAQSRQPYYWHGSPGTHWWFWNHYGWASRPSGITPQQPTTNSFGSAWSPTRRSTLFDRGGAGVGQTRGPSSDGRSGSYGRSGSGGSS